MGNLRIDNYDFKIEPLLGAGDAFQIIELALKAWGLDFCDLYRRLGIQEGDPRVDFDSKNLTVNGWSAICEILCIRLGTIQDGYCRREHLGETRWAVENTLVTFPKNAEMKRFLTEIRNIERAGYCWTLAHYGLRLRWKVRIARFREQAHSIIQKFIKGFHRSEDIGRIRRGLAVDPSGFEFYCPESEEVESIPGLRASFDARTSDGVGGALSSMA